MTVVRFLSPGLIALTLAACGGGGGGGGGGAFDTARLAREGIPIGSLICPAGGVHIEVGFDDNRNGVLDPAEVDQAEDICNGNDGLATLVDTTTEPAGANCVAGGQKIEAGPDANANDVLDAGEITQQEYVCNGTTGAAGADGYTTLTTFTTASLVTCPTGGTRIDAGRDLDRDNVLDAGEIERFSEVCNGAAGINTLANVTAETAGANCATGGQKLETGLDADRDSVLDAGEVGTTRYVCNGAAGSNGLNSLIAVTTEAAGANCTAGGKKIDSGLDDDRDSVLDAGEIDSTSYVCNGVNGSNGLNSLVLVTDEPAGANCTTGGSRIDAGLDDNSNNVLDAGEIDSTSYVCSVSVPTLFASELHPELCLHGGTVLSSGLDTNLNDTLDAGEVLSSTTICQNNSAPGLFPQFTELAGKYWFGADAVYDSGEQRYTIDAYDLGGMFRFTAQDANADPLTVLPGTTPTGFTALDDLIGLDVLLDFVFDVSLGAGTYDVVLGVTDTEASAQRTVRVNLHAPVWNDVPLPATEGTDTYAEVMVSFPEPLLAPANVTIGPISGWLEATHQPPLAEVCDSSGVDCQPLETLNFFDCFSGDPALCFFNADPAQVQLPAGTTSFLLRRPLNDDTLWGLFPYDYTLNLSPVPGSGQPSTTFPTLSGSFTVSDDDTAPVVSFDLAAGSVNSTEFINIALTSTQILTPVNFILSGDGVNGTDYFVETSINTGGNTTYSLFFGTAFIDSLLADLIVDITIDTSTGLNAGTNATHTVTIVAPPPRVVEFDNDGAGLSRYEPQLCATLVMNRVSLIGDVTVDLELGGSAIPGTDYVAPIEPIQAVIPFGETQAQFCIDLLFSQNNDDVTLFLDITNVDGENTGIGDITGQFYTLEGGPFPDVQFQSNVNSDLQNPATQSACATLHMDVVREDAHVTVTVQAGGTAVEGEDYEFSDVGVETAPGIRDYTIPAGDIEGVVCVDRKAFAHRPVGEASDIVLTITAVDQNMNIGTTFAATTFNMTEAYSARDLRTQHADDNGITQPLAVGLRDDRTVIAVSMSVNTATDMYRPAVRRLLADGTVDWDVWPVAPASLEVTGGVGDRDGGIGAVYDNFDTGDTHLFAVDSTGVLRYDIVVPAGGTLLAMNFGAALYLDTSTQDLLFYAADGSLVETRTLLEDGFADTVCVTHTEAKVAPLAFYVRRHTFGSACAIDADGDLDSGSTAFYRYGTGGVLDWARDGAAEVGVSWNDYDTVDALNALAQAHWAVDNAGDVYASNADALVKYNSAGVAVWTKGYGCGCAWQTVTRLAAETDGNVVRVRQYADVTVPGGGRTHIDAYDSAGTTLWTWPLGGLFADTDPPLLLWLVIDAAGTATTQFHGMVPFEPTVRRIDATGVSTLLDLELVGLPTPADIRAVPGGTFLFYSVSGSYWYDANMSPL